MFLRATRLLLYHPPSGRDRTPPTYILCGRWCSNPSKQHRQGDWTVCRPEAPYALEDYDRRAFCERPAIETKRAACGDSVCIDDNLSVGRAHTHWGLVRRHGGDQEGAGMVAVRPKKKNQHRFESSSSCWLRSPRTEMARIKTTPSSNFAPALAHKMSVAGEVKEKKKYRFKASTVTLRSIKKLQNSTGLLLQKAPFNKTVREITAGITPKTMYQKRAMEALQEAAESFLIERFHAANKHAIHAKRKTITVDDMKMAA